MCSSDSSPLSFSHFGAISKSSFLEFESVEFAVYLKLNCMYIGTQCQPEEMTQSNSQKVIITEPLL